MSTPKNFVASNSGERVDVFLSSQNPKISRKFAKKLCEQGLVRVNGKRVPPGRSLVKGEEVAVEHSLKPVQARAEKGEELRDQARILFEDEELLIVSKPRGVSSVTLAEEDEATLADLIIAHTGADPSRFADPREAGLVHRLDFWTSGLLIAAKSEKMLRALREQLMAQQIEKSYLALIEGVGVRDSFEIHTGLKQSSSGKKMVFEKEEEDSETRTEVEKLREFKFGDQLVNIVRAKAPRAKRHQVRAHFAFHGNPLVGDALYKAKTTLKEFSGEEELSGLDEGFLLHAESIRFNHPVSGKRIKMTDEKSPLLHLLERE